VRRAGLLSASRRGDLGGCGAGGTDDLPGLLLGQREHFFDAAAQRSVRCAVRVLQRLAATRKLNLERTQLLIVQLPRHVADELVQGLLAGLTRHLADPVDEEVADQHTSDQLPAQDRYGRRLVHWTGVSGSGATDNRYGAGFAAIVAGYGVHLRVQNMRGTPGAVSRCEAGLGGAGPASPGWGGSDYADQVWLFTREPSVEWTSNVCERGRQGRGR